MNISVKTDCVAACIYETKASDPARIARDHEMSINSEQYAHKDFVKFCYKYTKPNVIFCDTEAWNSK